MYPTTTRIKLYNRIQNYLNATSNFELSLYTRVKNVHPITQSNPCEPPTKKAKIDNLVDDIQLETPLDASNV